MSTHRVRCMLNVRPLSGDHMSNQITQKLEPLVRDLYRARNALRDACPLFSFTLDGKIVGDLGEAVAFYDYGLERLPSGNALHDFKAADGRHVQVKTTQAIKGGVGLGLYKQSFEHLIVFQVNEEGRFTIIYDGPGAYIDNARANRKSPSLSVAQLKRLNEKVAGHERILGGI